MKYLKFIGIIALLEILIPFITIVVGCVIVFAGVITMLVFPFIAIPVVSRLDKTLKKILSDLIVVVKRSRNLRGVK